MMCSDTLPPLPTHPPFALIQALIPPLVYASALPTAYLSTVYPAKIILWRLSWTPWKNPPPPRWFASTGRTRLDPQMDWHTCDCSAVCCVWATWSLSLSSWGHLPHLPLPKSWPTQTLRLQPKLNWPPHRLPSASPSPFSGRGAVCGRGSRPSPGSCPVLCPPNEPARTQRESCL